MAKHLTKYFGEIDFEKLEEWYESEVELNNEILEVAITVSVLSKSLDKEDFQKVDDYLENLQKNEMNIREYVAQDFKAKGEALNYIDFLIEELDKEDIADLIESTDKKPTKKEKLLSVLKLSGIVFYPEKEDGTFAIYDYTIDQDLTDELLAVKVYKDNTIRIDIES